MNDSRPPTSPRDSDSDAEDAVVLKRVTVAITVTLAPSGPFGRTVGVAWLCDACGPQVSGLKIAGAVSAAQAHLLKHHHCGADPVTS